MTNEMQADDRPKVLLVDPDPASRQAITALLEPRYRVAGAQSLAEADTSLRDELPAVLLLELDEPDGDGIAWIRRVRETVPRYDLIIACVTHRASVRDKVDGILAGADDYFVKPVPADLFLILIRLLQRIQQINIRRITP